MLCGQNAGIYWLTIVFSTQSLQFFKLRMRLDRFLCMVRIFRHRQSRKKARSVCLSSGFHLTTGRSSLPKLLILSLRRRTRLP
jgi:hypothetical protein